MDAILAGMDAGEVDAARLLTALSDATADAVIVTGADGAIHSWNRAAEVLLGPGSCADGEPSLADLDLRASGGLADLVATAIDTGATTHGPELPLRARHSSIVTTDVTVAPVPRPDGTTAGVVVVVRDTTRELALEQFAATAAHDLAEPARTVSGMVQLLAQQHADELGPGGLELVEFAVEGCTRMRDLIDSLLTYARAAEAPRATTAIDLSTLVNDVEQDLGGAITSRGAVITHGDLPEVVAAPDELRQVLANLISNAVKFVPPESVPQICIGASRGNGEWIVTVDDNGAGIDPQARDRVFGAFERLHVREAYPGTGIGLTICRRIVERRGGRIWSDSAPEGGTRFAFTIPDPPR